jgi:hypothetical protein
MCSCAKNPYKRDVSSIQVNFTLYAFENDILDLAQHFSEEKRLGMIATYPVFFEVFNEQIMRIGNSSDSLYSARLHEVMTDEYMTEMYKLTLPLRENRSEIHEKLHSALRYFRYYFPQNPLPQFLTFVGPGISVATIDTSALGIGLDRYLGSNAEIYKEMEIAKFTRQNMIPERIPVDVMRALAESTFPMAFEESFFEENYLLAHMIGHGRYMFFVKSMLPTTPDTIIWGYTAKQLEFVEKSEREFWKYFVSNNDLLFGSNYMDMKRFTEDGPFTHVFTRESPARIGQWVGFRIVESFMKQNPSVSMQELFDITSAQEIMQMAKYNP